MGLQSDSAGMADVAFQFGDKRQGHPIAEARRKTPRPTEGITADQLPTIIQMGDDSGFKRTQNARINPELHWFHKLSLAVMLAFQKDTYDVACKSVSLLETSAHKAVRDRIKGAGNSLKHGKCPLLSKLVG